MARREHYDTRNPLFVLNRLAELDSFEARRAREPDPPLADLTRYVNRLYRRLNALEEAFEVHLAACG